MSVHRIHLFGFPRIEENDQPIPLGRSKALALLAYLCRSIRPQSRELLIDLLWPAFTQADARNNLRRELSLLRRALPEGALWADRQIIGIEPTAWGNDLLDVDVVQFEAELDRARNHYHPGEPICEDCVLALESAAALYVTDFLAGFSLPDSPAFDEWQFHEAERLRRSLGSALETLAVWYEDQGEYARALGHARRRAALDPLFEEAQRAVMRLYNANGQQVAALRHFEQTRKLLLDDLGVLPEPETMDLYTAIREHRIPPLLDTYTAPQKITAAPPTVNLPADATLFIGRERELDHLGFLINDPAVRLITILGIGGMGKTRLGLAAARKVLPNGNGMSFPDGIFFIPLAPLTRPTEIASALALSLGFTPGGVGNPSRQLITYLKTRKALLIVDNIEHLIDQESTRLIGDILREAPDVKILATSRIRLGLAGEHVFTLRGLGEDARDNGYPGGDSERNDAAALYAESARRVQPSFQLDADNIDTINRICRLVGSMPLAIELAAGWTELLTPKAILKEIEKSLDFLESNLMDAPASQASLKAVFNSSWRLLTEEEQGGLRCLSVFPGTFGIEAAKQIAGASIRVLLSLANKSWLQPVGANRFQIHPLLRQYASLEMARFGQTESSLRDRHANFFADMLSTLDKDMRGRQPSVAFDAVAADLDNVRAATLWLIGNDRLEIFVNRMAIPLFRYLESRYQYFLFAPIIIEASSWADKQNYKHIYSILIVMRTAFFFNGYPTRFMDYHWGEPILTELMELAWQSYPRDTPTTDFWNFLLAWQYGRFVDVPAGVERLRGVLARLERSEHRWEEAFARQSLGRLLSGRPWDIHPYGRDGEARELLQTALSIFETLGDEREAAITLLFIGLGRQSASDLIEAKQILRQAQERLRGLGERIIAANVNWQLGEVHMRLGELNKSLDTFHEMADILIHSGRVQLAIAALSREAYEAVRYGNLEYALKLRENLLVLTRRSGDRFEEAWHNWEMGEVLRVMGRLDEARQWYESSRTVFKEIDNGSGESFYYRGLGDLALADGNAVAAETYFRSAIGWSERTNHPWQMAYSLSGLGKAMIAGGQTEEAPNYFAQGLEFGFNTGDPGVTLAVVGGVAQFYEQLGEKEQAKELAQLVLSHSLSWRETRQEMAELLGLPVEAALNRSDARPFDLAKIIPELVHELQERTG